MVSSTSPSDQHRRTSLGLFRRKSGSELKPTKKQQALAKEQELERRRQEATTIPMSPPRLPDLYNGQTQPTLPFGGDRDRPDSIAIISGNISGKVSNGRISMDSRNGRNGAVVAPPVPPIPANLNGSRNGDWVDPYARTESMTHRGRYSYASSAISQGTINSPRRVRRRKDPTPYK